MENEFCYNLDFWFLHTDMWYAMFKCMCLLRICMHNNFFSCFLLYVMIVSWTMKSYIIVIVYKCVHDMCVDIHPMAQAWSSEDNSILLVQSLDPGLKLGPWLVELALFSAVLPCWFSNLLFIHSDDFYYTVYSSRCHVPASIISFFYQVIWKHLRKLISLQFIIISSHQSVK